jgi:hypothetical protein
LRSPGEISEVGRDSKWIVLPHGDYTSRSDLHTWAFDEALVDGVTKRHVGIAGALVFNISRGCEASQ